MNRLQSWSEFHDNHPSSIYDVEQARLEMLPGDHVPHVLFAPLHYEANYAYPLLIWLHGPGDTEQQLMRVMPLISMRNFAAIAPRATVAETGSCGQPKTYCWSEEPYQIECAEQAVFDCIEAASERYHISASQVYLAGFHNGGTMALRLGLKHAEHFKGVISVGGSFPVGHQPLSCLKTVRQLSVMIQHSRDSKDYTTEKMCNDLRLFHSAGLKVTVRQYPCGDELTTKMLSDINVWIMEQVTGTSSESSNRYSYYRLGELN